MKVTLKKVSERNFLALAEGEEKRRVSRRTRLGASTCAFSA